MIDFIRLISMLSSEVTKNYAPLQLPVRPRKLIDLPENYLTLLSKADQFKCPNSVTKESKSPALCLVCGTIVCSQVCYLIISCSNVNLLLQFILPNPIEIQNLNNLFITESML